MAAAWRVEVPDEAFAPAEMRRSPQELGRDMRLAAAMLWYTPGTNLAQERPPFLRGREHGIDFIDLPSLRPSCLRFRSTWIELMEEVETTIRRIVNMSPLVFLVRADLLEILREGASEVVVPIAVLRELEAHGPDDMDSLGIMHAIGSSFPAMPLIGPPAPGFGYFQRQTSVLAKRHPDAPSMNLSRFQFKFRTLMSMIACFALGSWVWVAYLSPVHRWHRIIRSDNESADRWEAATRAINGQVSGLDRAEAILALYSALSDSSYRVRETAAFTLGKFQGPEARQPFPLWSRR